MMKKSFLHSLLIHGVVALALFISIHKNQEPPTVPVTIEFQVKAAKGSSVTSSKVKSGTNKHSASTKTTNIGASQLGIDFTQHTKTEKSGVDKSPDSSQGMETGDAFGIANTMSFQQEGKTYPFFNALWKKVDSSIPYPNELVDQDIKGRVTIQLSVDRRGVFTGNIHSINGAEPTVNAYAAAGLIHALRTALPDSLWMKEEYLKKASLRSAGSIQLVFHFDFDIFTHGQLPEPETQPNFKNILSFRKLAYRDPKLKIALDKIIKKYVPPVIILPGFFYIDFIRTYQMVNDIITNPPSTDELTSRRLESMKEKWFNLIQKREEKNKVPSPAT